MRALFRSLAVAWRTLSVVARLVVMAVFVAVWLTSSVATAVIPVAFGLASSVADLVVGASQTVRGKHQTQLAVRDDKLVQKARQAVDLSNENGKLKGQLETTRKETDVLRRKLAEADMVSYRGAKRPIREAVSDTSQRIARRTAAATSRNIATMPGESIPVYGIAVVVGATTWEVADACAMMSDMHALDVAFNPEHAISDREVCGMEVPTAGEIWERIKSAPGEIWQDMKDMNFHLPDLPFDDWAGTVVVLLDRFADWIGTE
ncbi:hypothetical protein [Albidovulum sp.]|uniref:hypothetical protein n=1 Tax=Albidovulum sp. TaxID=1872424 RepID=UPI0039B8C261